MKTKNIKINGISYSKRFPFTNSGKIAASKWYNQQAIKHFKEFAFLNKIEEKTK